MNQEGERLWAIRTKRTLEDQGWVRRFLAAPDRVDEAVEVYEEMGFEVHVVKPDARTFDDDCRACTDEICRTHLLIYTRVKEKP